MRYPLLFISVIFLVVVAGCISQTPQSKVPKLMTTTPLPLQHDVGQPKPSTYEITSIPTTVSITIPLPVDCWIEIVPMSDKKVGDKFEMNGVTNLEVGSKILITVRSIDGDKIKGMSGEVNVQKGTSGINYWQFHVDLSSTYPGKYIFEAKDYDNENVNASNRIQINP